VGVRRNARASLAHALLFLHSLAPMHAEHAHILPFIAAPRVQRRGSTASLFLSKRKRMTSFVQGGDIARLRGRCG
jgi:hypothetical protein